MKKRDLILALLVVIIWGANFTVIKLGLAGISSMLLVALRFTFTVFPAIFFVKKPAVSWYYCLAYGLTFGVGQFGFIFYALEMGMPAGISSVVVQSQVFFTIGFAAPLLAEAPKKEQVAGLIIAALGLYFIAGRNGSGTNDELLTVSLLPFLFTLAGAACFGLANIVVKHAVAQALVKGTTLDTFSLLIWSSLVPPLPFLALALWQDSPQAIMQSLLSIDAQSIFALLYLVVGATLFGYGVWNRLLAQYPASKAAPLALLVPVTGLITAQIILNERLSKQQWLAGAAIILGLAVANFASLPARPGTKPKSTPTSQ
jgi:O-acetylserine/cysteine efflux transporter